MPGPQQTKSQLERGSTVGFRRWGARKWDERKAEAIRTRDASVPVDLVAVPAAIAPSEVQRLMHVADEVDEELEGLLHEVGCAGRDGGGEAACGRGAAHKVGQDGADVLYRVEDVRALLARPAVRAGEDAVVRRVVADRADVVQLRGPARAEADLVGPGGDRREVARRVAVGLGLVGAEDGTDGV